MGTRAFLPVVVVGLLVGVLSPDASARKKLGIPACDEYLDNYRYCLRNKVPEASRPMMEKSLKTTHDAWKKAASNPAERRSLRQACETASAAAARAMKSFGCDWPERAGAGVRHRPEFFAGAHILIAYKGATRAPPKVTRTKTQAFILAKEVAVRATRNPLKFADLARRYSDGPSGPRGGSLGKWPKGRMVPAFELAIQRLEIGKVTSAPVETPFGFHVIMRGDPGSSGTPQGGVPKAIVKRSAPQITGHINANAASAVIRRGMGAIRTCYQRRLKLAPHLKGKLDCKLWVTKDGKVADVNVSGTLNDPEVASCIKGHARRWRFPAPTNGRAEITVPFAFTALR